VTPRPIPLDAPVTIATGCSVFIAICSFSEPLHLLVRRRFTFQARKLLSLDLTSWVHGHVAGWNGKEPEKPLGQHRQRSRELGTIQLWRRH